MSWNVEYTDEFGVWWAKLTNAEQEDISAVAEILMERGPDLPFPYSSGVEGSKHSHMRELRVQSGWPTGPRLLRVRSNPLRDPASWGQQDRR